MGIYQHYREDEHPFIDQVLSWLEKVETMYEPRLTDFLNPREQQIIAQIIGENHDIIKYSFFGGNEKNERKRAIIAPFYYDVVEDDYLLTILEATYQTKFINIEHRDVLGALMSLGIERKIIGDIVIDDGLIQFATTNEMDIYVRQNLTNIKNTSIRLRDIPSTDFKLENKDWVERSITVSSMRLDAVISEIYHVSRRLAAEMILKSRIQVNFKVIEDGKFVLEPGDLISFRGKGRSKIIRLNGITRKARTRVDVAQLKA